MRSYNAILALVGCLLVCLCTGMQPNISQAGSDQLRFYTAFEEISYQTPPGFVAQSGLDSRRRLELLREKMEPDFKIADLLISTVDPAFFAFIGYAARDLYLPQSPEQFAHRMTGLRAYLEQGWLDEQGQFSPELNQDPALTAQIGPEQGWLLLNQEDRMAFSLYLTNDNGPVASTACHIFCHGLVVEIHIQRQLKSPEEFPAFAAESLELLKQINLYLVV